MHVEHSPLRRQSCVSELTRLLSECSTRTECQVHDTGEQLHTHTSLPIPIPRSTCTKPRAHNSLPYTCGQRPTSSMIARPPTSVSRVSPDHPASPVTSPTTVGMVVRSGSEPRQCPQRNSPPAGPANTQVLFPASFPSKFQRHLGNLMASNVVPPCEAEDSGVQQEDGRPVQTDHVQTDVPAGIGVCTNIEAGVDGTVDVALAQSGPWHSAYSPFGNSPCATVPGTRGLANQVGNDRVLCTTLSNVVGAPGGCASIIGLDAAASGLSGALFSFDEDLNKTLTSLHVNGCQPSCGLVASGCGGVYHSQALAAAASVVEPPATAAPSSFGPSAEFGCPGTTVLSRTCRDCCMLIHCHTS